MIFDIEIEFEKEQVVTHLSTDQVKSCLTLQSTLAILEKCHQISQITFISHFSRFKNTSPYVIIKLIATMTQKNRIFLITPKQGVSK